MDSVAHAIVTRESARASARLAKVAPRLRCGCARHVFGGAGLRVAAVVAWLAVPACERPRDATTTDAVVEAPAKTCDPGPIPAVFAPGIDATLETAATWASDDDTVLADATRLAEHRLATSRLSGGAVDPWDPGIDSANALLDAHARLARLRQDLREGVTVASDGAALLDAQAALEGATAVDHARLIVEPTQLYCTATQTTIVSASSRDVAFDRNLCTTLHPGEMVRMLARAEAGRWSLVHAGHTAGWIRGGVSERLDEATRLAWRAADRVWSLRDDVTTDGGVSVPLGVGLPLVEGREDRLVVWVAGRDGPVEDTLATSAAVSRGAAPLQRRAVIATALAHVGAPYGWGGREGHRDCSQFLRDVFLPYGVELPRHSSTQADAGFTTVDVAGWTAEAKHAAIAEHGARGLVLEYMPGHVMLDLGERDGRRFSISAIAEFVVPCADGVGETLHRIDRVAVTDLETGRGSSRGAFIDRITKLAVFGPASADP